jgi:hypothetical protein
VYTFGFMQPTQWSSSCFKKDKDHSKIEKSEYEVQQVDPKDAGRQNFSFLTFKRELQLLFTTARDRLIFFSKIMFFSNMMMKIKP